MTGSGNWGAQWSADEVAQLRSVLGLSKLSFADRLRVHRRTASRWERGATAPTDHRIIEALDDLLCETVSELSP
ncbi:MAG: helix-turn-helix domain-containing protein, partial [Pseudonocardiaceae bacterium]